MKQRSPKLLDKNGFFITNLNYVDKLTKMENNNKVGGKNFMKLLRTLSVAAVAITLSVTSITQAGKGGSKETEAQIKKPVETGQTNRKAVETLLNATAEGRAAYAAAKQVINVRTSESDKNPSVKNPEVTEKNLAIAIFRGFISRDTLDILLKNPNHNTSKMYLDAILVAAERGMIGLVGDPMKDGNEDGSFYKYVSKEKGDKGKAFLVNVADSFANQAARSVTEKWSPASIKKLEEFSLAVREAIVEQGAPNFIKAIRIACDRLNIKFEDFIRLCLKK